MIPKMNAFTCTLPWFYGTAEFRIGHYIGRTAADTTRIAAGKSNLALVLLFLFLSELLGGGVCARRRKGTGQRADPLLSPQRHRDTTEESMKTQAPAPGLLPDDFGQRQQA